MHRLILMRHAKSDWHDPTLRDHDRPLNARGRKAAVSMGDWLRTKAYLPDQVLCSTARRTQETLAGLGLDGSIPVTLTRDLYLAEAQEMLRTLQGASRDRVLMLGHNGGIGEMAQRLVPEPLDHPRFEDYPTCATLVCDFDVGSWKEIGWHQGQPIDFVVPRDLI
jgi:phosphohistidine phosphatase